MNDVVIVEAARTPIGKFRGALAPVRADHLGCYGWHRNTSPHLDRFAEQGVLFENCFSPWIPTHPAHTTMLTGCDVMRHQIVAQRLRVEQASLEDAFVALTGQHTGN